MLISISHSASVAQLDRVPGYEPGGQRFESSRTRHILLEYESGEVAERLKALPAKGVYGL